MSAELIEFSNALAQATERAAAFAVAVHTEARGSSSGVIWRSGVIVTAEHALRRDEEIHVTLPDGRIAPATLAGRDPSTDLAVLRCAEVGVAPVEHGDAAETVFVCGLRYLCQRGTQVTRTAVPHVVVELKREFH